MNKTTKLKAVSAILKSFIKKEKSNVWITPDDKRYTKILKKYEKKLSKHWKNTRDEYLKKLKKTKEVDFDIDEEVEDYTNPEQDSSNYIDEALAILALAFGEGVIVGYEELIGRDYSVDIPENPHKLFDEALEIKNYAWAALSYEDSQMNDLLSEYKNEENAKEILEQWFKNNEYRLTDLMLGGVVWYGINYGLGRAATNFTPQEGQKDVEIFWITENDTKVCRDCLDLQKGSPYGKGNPLKTLPGGGKTVCGSSCRCVIDIKEVS